MQKTCANCSQRFIIDERDHSFYTRIGVPEPTWCPLCRHIRRHGHINDYTFFTRTCDSCRKHLVSTFPAQSPYHVFCQECWYADSRDDKAEGRLWDPERSFFEQFNELNLAASQMGIIGQNNENCDYCESIANCKNCYLISECSNCEDCYYSYWIQKTQDSFDCSYTHGCERCYWIIDCFSCYRLQYGQDCVQCSDSYFLDNCSDCKHCLCCTNLRQKEYHIFNEPHTKEQYGQRAKELGSYSATQKLRKEFQSFLQTKPRRHLQVVNCENCTGNYIRNAKNCKEVYHCYDAEECAYGEHVWRGAKYCYDANTAGRNAELLYETTNTSIDAYNSRFCRYCWGCRDSEYCNQCKQGYRLFGCVSLKPGNQFCVLNAQYTESEWNDLTAQIRAKMCGDGEYGEFFPLSISLFGYNTSTSFDEFPLSKEEVLAKGWKWEDREPGTRGQGTLPSQKLPDSIDETTDVICDEALTCMECERNYKIIKQELTFYREERIPLPKQCPICRYRSRLKERHPRKLWNRPCAKCQKPIATSYSPDRPEIVYCERCYLATVY